MKICFLINNYSFIGGAERVTSLIANELSKKNTVEVISLYDTVSKCIYKYRKSIKITVLYRKSNKNYVLDTIPSIIKLRKIVKKNKYDYLIFVGELIVHYAMLSCLKTKTKTVCWMHTPANSFDETILQRPFKYMSIKLSDFVITLTNESKEIMKKRYKSNYIFDIANPIDPTLLSREIEYNPFSKKIISVGRICYPKYYEKLVEVASIALPRLSGWSWDVYGDGDIKIKATLEDEIEKKKLVGRLNLKGNVNNIYDIYNEYSIFVLTSRREGFPMVLIEAVSKGLPIVSFDISTGPKEIVKNKINGYLIEPFDSKKMADRIIELANNREKRIEISKFDIGYRKKYDVAIIGEEWQKLLIANHNKQSF